MKYYTRGWNKYHFLISPDELETIIKPFYHVVYTRRVPEDYIETNPKEYINKYKIFYEKLISNYKFIWKNDHKLLDLNVGLTNDLSKCTYGEKFLDKKDQKYYRINDFKEPPVGLTIFILFLSKDRKLFTNYSYIQYPENVIGLEIQYPEDVYYYEQENSEIIFKEKINCAEIETYNQVYQPMVTKIESISKNLKFVIDGKESATVIKVSKNITDEIKNIHFIKSKNCIIK